MTDDATLFDAEEEAFFTYGAFRKDWLITGTKKISVNKRHEAESQVSALLSASSYREKRKKVFLLWSGSQADPSPQWSRAMRKI